MNNVSIYAQMAGSEHIFDDGLIYKTRYPGSHFIFSIYPVHTEMNNWFVTINNHEQKLHAILWDIQSIWYSYNQVYST